ncbi:hypothetical protein L208DRAFT_1375655 [Tricholoma matsutake]|nr:hypothetical protein L208DRAFT_1375655 [Tricholoma matsutake 945]
MGKPHKSQKASAPVPAPMATRNGCQRTYTTKQMENIMTQMTREDVTKKKKFIATLCTEQELEEHMGFAPNPILHHTQGKFLFFFLVGYYSIGELSDEGDNEYEEEDTFFLCITVPPPIKTVIHNGCTLVHRVPAKENGELESGLPHPWGALVCHVPVTYPVPVRMEQDRPPSQVSDKENHELVGTPAPESEPPHQWGAQIAGTPAV